MPPRTSSSVLLARVSTQRAPTRRSIDRPRRNERTSRIHVAALTHPARAFDARPPRACAHVTIASSTNHDPARHGQTRDARLGDVRVDRRASASARRADWMVTRCVTTTSRVRDGAGRAPSFERGCTVAARRRRERLRTVARTRLRTHEERDVDPEFLVMIGR